MTPFSQEAALSLKAHLGSSAEPREFRGETTLEIDCFQIQKAARHLKEILGFSFLVDVTSIDNLPAKPRFEIAYEFYHFEKCSSLRLKIRVAEDQKVPSVTSIYATADWHEREIYDMMGIDFEGHPDLRRILMWEGYPYFPLRKDFPLEGKPTDMPDEAFTEKAPLEGGPFVAAPASLSMDREPRARPVSL